MAKTVRVCGNPITVAIKQDGFLAGTKKVKTICGRPPEHTEGNCAPGPSSADLLKKASSLW